MMMVVVIMVMMMMWFGVVFGSFCIVDVICVFGIFDLSSFYFGGLFVIG